jgi:hypothetical protein
VNTRGPEWGRTIGVIRRNPRSLKRTDIPKVQGVYIWFRDGEPVYVGEALGKNGLYDRLGAHLATNNDLSHSTLRASVAVAQLGVERSMARRRPSVMNNEQVSVVNEWLGGCELGWVECDDARQAHALEVALRGEWLPSLNIR